MENSTKQEKEMVTIELITKNELIKALNYVLTKETKRYYLQHELEAIIIGLRKKGVYFNNKIIVSHEQSKMNL